MYRYRILTLTLTLTSTSTLSLFLLYKIGEVKMKLTLYVVCVYMLIHYVPHEGYSILYTPISILICSTNTYVHVNDPRSYSDRKYIIYHTRCREARSNSRWHIIDTTRTSLSAALVILCTCLGGPGENGSTPLRIKRL